MIGSVIGPRERGDRHGFTLIELLVVVGVIAVLAAILVPVIVSSKRQAKQANCTANLRNLWLGLSLYCEDRGGGWVRAPRYLTYVFPYGRSKEIFLCPSDPRPRGLSRYPVVIPPAGRREDQRWVDYPVSYYYARHEPPMHGDGWPVVLRRWPRLALVVCPWHGNRVNIRGLPADFPYYVGKVVRLRTDGSISVGTGIPFEDGAQDQTIFATRELFYEGGRE